MQKHFNKCYFPYFVTHHGLLLERHEVPKSLKEKDGFKEILAWDFFKRITV